MYRLIEFLRGHSWKMATQPLERQPLRRSQLHSLPPIKDDGKLNVGGCCYFRRRKDVSKSDDEVPLFIDLYESTLLCTTTYPEPNDGKCVQFIDDVMPVAGLVVSCNGTGWSTSQSLDCLRGDRTSVSGKLPPAKVLYNLRERKVTREVKIGHLIPAHLVGEGSSQGVKGILPNKDLTITVWPPRMSELIWCAPSVEEFDTGAQHQEKVDAKTGAVGDIEVEFELRLVYPSRLGEKDIDKKPTPSAEVPKMHKFSTRPWAGPAIRVADQINPAGE